MPACSLIFKSWVSSHYFYFEFSQTPLHRLLILPLRPRMWNLQSNSQPGNKMSALKYFRDLRTSHPRHLDRVSSSLKCISPKMFLTSKGIGMSSSLCLQFSFATHICVRKDGLYCEISHWTLIIPEMVPIHNLLQINTFLWSRVYIKWSVAPIVFLPWVAWNF